MDALEALLHPDFFEIGVSGKRWSREQVILALLKEKPMKYESSEYTGTLLGTDVAIISYKTIQEEIVALRSSIWVKKSVNWQMVFHQGTRLVYGGN